MKKFALRNIWLLFFTYHISYFVSPTIKIKITLIMNFLLLSQFYYNWYDLDEKNKSILIF